MSESLQLLAAKAALLDKLQQIGIQVEETPRGIQPVGLFDFHQSPFDYAPKRATLLELREENAGIHASCTFPNNGDMRHRSHINGDDLADPCRMFAEGLSIWHTLIRRAHESAKFHISRRDRAFAAFNGDKKAWFSQSVVCVPAQGAEDTVWTVEDNGGVGWDSASRVPTSEMYRLREVLRGLPFNTQRRDRRHTTAGQFAGEIRWAEEILAKPVPKLPMIANRFPGIRRMFENLKDL